ncbi:MAG: AAA family ATPase [Cyanobacteriota bacterium]|nr:AAA family ATPase [Cyanobacteriota bacterium]
MSLNIQELAVRFNAGMATISIDVPPSAESRCSDRIIKEFAIPQGMRVLGWDSINSLKRWVFLNDRTPESMCTQPVEDFQVRSHPVADLFKYLRLLEYRDKTLILAKDILHYLDRENPAVLRAAIDCCYHLKRSPHRLVLFHNGLSIPSELNDLVDTMHEPLPDGAEVSQLLEHRLRVIEASAQRQNKSIAIDLTEDSRTALVRALKGLTAEAIDDALQLAAVAHREISHRAIDIAISLKKQQLAQLGLRYAPTPEVEVAGLDRVKTWAACHAALLNPQCRHSYNLSLPKGLLFVGLPGTGKSLAVKALAHEWNVPCVTFELGSLMQRQLGESEANLRRLLAAAEALAPCLLFADELDKQLGGSSDGETDGGTSQRMLAYLLNWLAENQSEVIFCATANRPWGFSPELLRRFEVKFLVGLPDTETRGEIWRNYLEHHRLELSTEDIAELADRSVGYTGDEIRRLARASALECLTTDRPGGLSQMLAQLSLLPPQFRHCEEGKALERWAAAGNAIFASTRPTDSTTRERSVLWNAEEIG